MEEQTALQQFVSEDGCTVRVVDVDGDAWFVATDVCEVLDLTDTSRAVGRLDEDEKGTTAIRTPGGNQQMLIVNESGLYHLIFTSRKPEAEKFRRWITNDVIPAIRKTGLYVAKELSPAEMLVAMANRLLEQENALKEHEQRMGDIELRQNALEKSTEYFTIIAFANRLGQRIDNNQAQSLGKYASRYSRKHGYPIGHASDTRYGMVGTYHEEVLLAVFGVK